MTPHIVVLEQLPRSANGKVDRVALRELCVQLAENKQLQAEGAEA